MRKQNWAKILYIHCWAVLLSAIIIAFDIIPITPSFDPLPVRMMQLMKYLFYLCLIAGVLFLIYKILKTFKPTKKGPWILSSVFFRIIVYPLLIISYPFACITITESAALSGICLLAVMVVLFILLALYLILSDPHSRHRYALEQNKSKTLWHTSLLALAVLGATFWIPGMWGIHWPPVQLSGDLLGYYGAQLSLTFITISVMSVLSDKSVVVYWENIAEAKLIKPLFGSFASYTAYSITATVGAGISALLGNHLAFLVFFALNIPILILLTLTMVDVYYGREGKKKGLEKILQENAAAWLFSQKLQNLPDDWDMTVSLANRTAEFRNHMLQLEHQLHLARNNHDLPYINELLSLYGKNMHCFVSGEGEAVAALLQESIADPWTPILMATDAHTSELENSREPFEEPFKKDKWRSDEALWKALASNSYLRDALPAAPESAELPSVLAWVALHRMTLLFNDTITAHYPNSYLRRQYVVPELQGNVIIFHYHPATLATSFDSAKFIVMESNGLLSQLLQLLLLAAKFGTPQTLECIRNCPFLPLLADSFQFLGLSESDAKFLQSLSANIESFSPEA